LTRENENDINQVYERRLYGESDKIYYGVFLCKTTSSLLWDWNREMIEERADEIIRLDRSE